MKELRLRSLFFAFATLIVLSACSQYAKLLKSDDNDLKYKAAKEYYINKKYDKALPLFESVLAAWKGQDKSEEVYYYYSYTEYGMGNLASAAFHFKNFTETFFTSKHLQECAFMKAQCEYEMVMPVELDQSQTKTAIDELQLFINLHPTSEYVDSCNVLMDDLRKLLIKKDYNKAVLYYNIERYKSAIAAFENLQKDYPDIANPDVVDFYIIKAHQKLAENSVPSKLIERWKETKEVSVRYIAKYGEANKAYKKVLNIKNTAEKRLKLLKAN